MKRLCLISFLLLATGCATTVSLNIRQQTAVGKLNPVIYYTGSSGTPNLEQVVLFVRGTGRFPASHDFGMGAEATLVGFSVVYPQKSYVDDEKQYFVHDCREQRMHDLGAVIDDLLRRGTHHILLLADSEGTMLAPEIARRYTDKICGLVCMSGSLSVFEEDLRYCNGKGWGVFGQISRSELESWFECITREPEDTKQVFFGHSFKFWNSYLHYDPMPDLKSLKCPVLYLNGEHDGVDFKQQQQRLLQLRADNVMVEQKIYLRVGHELKALSKTMFRDILAWAKRNKVAGI